MSCDWPYSLYHIKNNNIRPAITHGWLLWLDKCLYKAGQCFLSHLGFFTSNMAQCVAYHLRKASFGRYKHGEREYKNQNLCFQNKWKG